MPNYYLVSQNKSFKDENSKSYMWSPLTGKNGRFVWAYYAMQNIKAGDVIIHYNNDIIPGISIAKTDAYKSPKPDSIGDSEGAWNEQGVRVDVEQFFIKGGIKKEAWIKFFYEYQPEVHGPVAQTGDGSYKINLAYLFSVNKKIVEKVIQLMAERSEPEFIKKLLERINSTKNDTEIPESQEEERKMTETQEKIEKIKNYIAAKGFSYDGLLIENFYLSLKSKPFVILAGISGTGKSKLVELFSEAIGAEYESVSVSPDWSDSSDLFGHYDLQGNFIEGKIYQFLKSAEENIEKPYLLCLDEMNLARVEYYFSDFLSKIETRKWDGDNISCQTLFKTREGNELKIPENLYLIGTVNMDETTFQFSKKVLDRANTIEFSKVNLVPDFGAIPNGVEKFELANDFLKSEYITLIDCKEEPFFVTRICKELQEINKILEKNNSHVGYRVRDEIVFYMLNNDQAELMSFEDAFDYEIMQKILPRISGSDQSVCDVLEELLKEFCELDYENVEKADASSDVWGKYPRTAQKLVFMIRRFKVDGFTSYWI